MRERYRERGRERDRQRDYVSKMSFWVTISPFHPSFCLFFHSSSCSFPNPSFSLLFPRLILNHRRKKTSQQNLSMAHHSRFLSLPLSQSNLTVHPNGPTSSRSNLSRSQRMMTVWCWWMTFSGIRSLNQCTEHPLKLLGMGTKHLTQQNCLTPTYLSNSEHGVAKRWRHWTRNREVAGSNPDSDSNFLFSNSLSLTFLCCFLQTCQPLNRGDSSILDNWEP